MTEKALGDENHVIPPVLCLVVGVYQEAECFEWNFQCFVMMSTFLCVVGRHNQVMKVLHMLTE